MRQSKKWQWVLAAAVSVTLAGSALAQYRVGNDGRALDANNRIGSGGANTGGVSNSGANAYGGLGNNIIYGNVTRGLEFRGDVPYGDPRAFRGTTAGGLSDRFIRSSSGAGFGGVSQNNAQVAQQFYGESRAVAPPAGTVQQGIGTSGYVPAPTLTRQPGDFRLGDVIGTSTTILPQPGQLVLPGPVDPNTQTSSVITASPLYGVRQWNLGNEADQTFLNNNMGEGTISASRLDPVTLQRLRDELAQPVPTDQPEATEGGQDGGRTQGSNGPVVAPFESPQNSPLSANAALQSGAGGSPNAINGNLATGAGVKQRLLVSPERQSKQYAELSKRLQQYRVVQEMGDASASREYNRQLRLKQEQEAKAGKKPGEVIATPPAAGGPGPGVQPDPMKPPTVAPAPTEQVQIPDMPADLTPTPSNLPRPVQIRSLAEGVEAKGLADLLKQAEDYMKAGKYNSALEQYDLAEQVAANNPLILLGKANVELGQSYYTRAETHLRQAFMQDQALLMGQYDLRALIGAERLEYLVKDLKEVAKQETRQARPVFLLAYIAYNTGNERMAAAYLDLAEKRAGANDPLYPLIRKHWSLPKDAGPSETDALNK